MAKIKKYSFFMILQIVSKDQLNGYEY